MICRASIDARLAVKILIEGPRGHWSHPRESSPKPFPLLFNFTGGGGVEQILSAPFTSSLNCPPKSVRRNRKTRALIIFVMLSLIGAVSISEYAVSIASYRTRRSCIFVVLVDLFFNVDKQ